MGVLAEIVRLGQDLDLDTGKMVESLILRLEDGTTVRAIVSSDVVEAVLNQLAASKVGVPNNPVPAEEPREEFTQERDGSLVFGGAAPAPPPAYGHGEDPGELVGQDDRDDDGVGSL